MKLLSQYKGLRRENYILFLGRIVTNLGSMIWPVMTMILNQKMGFSAAEVAIVMIVVGAIQMPLGLLGGKWADNYNKKNMIVLFDIISVVFYITCAFLPLSWLSLILLFTASGLQGMEKPCYNALIADITKTKDRDRAYSLSYLGGNIGLVASPTIAGFLFENYLWLSFLISGLAIFTSTVLIFFFVKDITPVEEKESTAKYQESDNKASAWEILKANKVLFLYMMIMALYWGAYDQYGYLMPLDLARVHGEKGALIYGSVSSLNCIVVVLCTPIITALLSKLSYTKKNLISMFLVLGGYMIFLFGLGIVPVYYIAITLFTWGEILSTTVSGPYTTERIPASHRGRMNSVMGMLQSIIAGIIMYTTGFLFDNLGSVVAWSFIFLLLGMATAGSIILIPLDKKAYKELYDK